MWRKTTNKQMHKYPKLLDRIMTIKKRKEKEKEKARRAKEDQVGGWSTISDELVRGLRGSGT